MKNKLNTSQNSIDKSFGETLLSDEALSIVKEYSELGIDSVLKDGLLKDIPLIGTLVSLYKIGGSLKERNEFKKIAVFLNQLSDIPIEQRIAFQKKLEEKDQYRESTFEKVLLLLSRLDETQKAELVGNLFKLYILEVISKEKFLRLSGIVERILLYDLLALHYRESTFNRDWEGKQPYSLHNASTSSLFSLGLMEQQIKERSSPSGRGSGYLGVTEPYIEMKVSSLGRELADLLIYDLKDPDFIDHITRLKKRNRENL
ncbi:hypothetical protein [Pedobacter aquatilis]|uniref:hypothetical protein n=1 Tax=Pedobacter aquatilis TaxID=351343 RepID=UPI00292E0E71|nr:hypothetical protein [Pedobacter aquatilis]